MLTRRQLLVGAGLPLILGSAAGAEEHPTLRVNNMVEPESLDPALVTGMPEHRVVSSLFEGLTSTDAKDLSPKPGVAAAWTVSPDGLVYIFHLREAHWTDGRPVTAHDFVFAWERVLNPKTGAKYAQQLYYLRGGADYNRGKQLDFRRVGVEAVSDRVLRVTLGCPTPYFLALTGFYTLYPVPASAIAAHGRDWVKPGKLISNGPFRLVSWVPQKELVLERNPGYWDARSVKLGRIVFLPTEDAGTAYKQFLAGESDWVPQVPTPQLAAARRRREFYAAPYLGTYFLRLNVTRPPLTDVRVRKALNLGVDRETLTRYVTKAGEIPSAGFVPPGMPGYDSVHGLVFDPDGARRLLGDAGYPGGRGFPRLELLYNTNEVHRVVTQAVQQMWKEELGILVDLVNVEWKVYLARQSGLDYQIARSGWIGDYLDPNTFLDLWITGSGNNETGWSNPRYDALLAQAACALQERRARLRALQEAERILVVEEVPIVPLFTYVNKGLLSRRVRGWWPNLLDQHPLKEVALER